MRTLLTWIVSLWKSITSFFRPHNPYEQKLQTRMRLLQPRADGSVEVVEDTTKWGFVSRHGLLQVGIICPYCAHEAARTNEFHLIHKTRLGEAVNCPSCHAVLLASPDDDVDPVNPRKSYDEEVYHKFARPVKRRRIGQRLTGDKAVMGDWVVITSDRLVLLEQVGTPDYREVVRALPPVNYFGAEGRVDSIEDDGTVLIALNGNHGIAGAGLQPGQGLGGAWARFKRDEIAVMVMERLQPGDKVRITRGSGKGLEGTFAVGDKGAITVRLPEGEEVTVPIERVEKVIENEQVV